MKIFHWSLSCLAAFGTFVAASAPSSADEPKKFVMISKMLNHPFFELASQGCKKADAAHPEYSCEYLGLNEPNEEEQLRIVEDVLTRGADGLAISPINASAMAKLVKRANSQQVPIITWDNDFIEKDKPLRATYVGTDNYQIGVELGKALIKLRPQGGQLAIQTGSAASHSLNERVRGLRETIKEHNFTELPGTPLYCNDDSSLSIKQLEDLLTRNPELNAFVPVGAWPQSVHRAYRQVLESQLPRLKSKELVIVSADTLPMQMDLLKEGYTHALIGQRPTEMGEIAMDTLYKITQGTAVPPQILTGLDICYLDNIESCLGGALMEAPGAR